MRIIDVDSHLHEPLDWVERTDPGLAEALGPPARFMDIASSVFGFSDPSFVVAARGAAAQRPLRPGAARLRPPPRTDRHAPARAAGGVERRPVLRARGTAGVLRRARHRRPVPQPDVPRRRRSCRRAGPAAPTCCHRIRRCWNQWSTDLVHGHTDRLIPVTQIDLGDVDWSVAEMTRMRGNGQPRLRRSPRRRCAAAAHRVGRRALARSITHPDFEPIWDAAEDLGMAAFAHVGFARERINPGWANNGADDLNTFSLLNMLVGLADRAAAPRRRARLRRRARAPPEPDRRGRGGRHRLAAPPAHGHGAQHRAHRRRPPRRRGAAEPPRRRRQLHAAAGARRLRAPPGPGDAAAGHAPAPGRHRARAARDPVLLQRLPARRGQRQRRGAVRAAARQRRESATTSAPRSSAASGSCSASDHACQPSAAPCPSALRSKPALAANAGGNWLLCAPIRAHSSISRAQAHEVDALPPVTNVGSCDVPSTR